MTRPINSQFDFSDNELKALLRKHDPIAPMTSWELARLEAQILAKIDPVTGRIAPAPMQIPVWIFNSQSWLPASMATLVVAFLVMGIVIGGDLSNMSSAEAQPSYVFASGTPWQSFLASPSLQGETDETSE